VIAFVGHLVDSTARWLLEPPAPPTPARVVIFPQGPNLGRRRTDQFVLDELRDTHNLPRSSISPKAARDASSVAGHAAAEVGLHVRQHIGASDGSLLPRVNGPAASEPGGGTDPEAA
jgi:hypothetical protein